MDAKLLITEDTVGLALGSWAQQEWYNSLNDSEMLTTRESLGLDRCDATLKFKKQMLAKIPINILWNQEMRKSWHSKLAECKNKKTQNANS